MSGQDDIKTTVDIPPELQRAMRNAITERRFKSKTEILIRGARLLLDTPVPEEPSGLPPNLTDEEKNQIYEMISFWRRGKKFRDWISAFFTGIKVKFPE